MHHAPLLTARVAPSTALPHPPGSTPGTLTSDDPASLAMTDFRREPALTVAASEQIDVALKDMIRLGVRALLVVHHDDLVGLITAYDIQGERPGQFLQNPSCDHSPCLRRDIHVGEIMTPWCDLDVLTWKALESAKIGALLETLTSASLTHLVVIEPGTGDDVEVRGLVSRTRVERLLADCIFVAKGLVRPAARG
jgi:CBS domain-containing protein